MSRHLCIAVAIAIFFACLPKLATASDGAAPLTDFAKSRSSTAAFDSQTLSLPFAADAKVDRSYADFDLKRDLSLCDEFKLTIDVSDTAAVGNVTLYFKCGGGWYGCGRSLTGTGKQQLHFARGDFKPEDKPSGWDNAEVVRVAFWRGDSVDASVKLLALEGVTLSTLVVIGDENESRSAARRVINQCENAGVHVAQVSQDALTPALLANRKCVVLPLNPKLSANTDALLKDFVAAGGKLITLDKVADGDSQSIVTTLSEYDPQIRRDILTELAKRIARIGQLPGDPHGRFSANYHEREASLLLAFGDTERELSNEEFAAIYVDGQCVYRGIAADYLRALPSPRGEFRAWWEHAGTGAYAGDWDRTMRELSENGFTAVIPNMLWGGVAHYASDLLPRSATYEKYGDQIAQAVAAGKKYGIEVHVWKVNFNASYSPPTFKDAMTREHRFQKKSDGTEQPWLCPSDPRNKKLECDAMLEVATNYDVDGIHFDYIRYPGDDSCFCDGCKERFTQHTVDGGKTIPESWNDTDSGWNNWVRDCTSGTFRADYDDWRCEQITELVAMVRAGVDKLKERKPNLKVSAAVFPAYPGCRKWVLQDWPVWVERGYLDFVCPMDYTESVTQFGGYVGSQLARVHGKIPVYPGIGATATGIAMRPEDVAVQIETLRQRGARGFTIFNLDSRTIENIVPPLATGPTSPSQHIPQK
ncbi:MAG: family 10 glycosylhydrolase [Thermoguttaceae bacterium]